MSVEPVQDRLWYPSPPPSEDWETEAGQKWEYEGIVSEEVDGYRMTRYDNADTYRLMVLVVNGCASQPCSYEVSPAARYSERSCWTHPDQGEMARVAPQGCREDEHDLA